MKQLFLCWIALILTTSALAGTHYIGHVAGENWTTTITVYNAEPESQLFTLYRWDEAGTETVTAGISVPGGGEVILTNADFGYLGIARIDTALDVQLNVKLAYRYRDSHSLCEFFIPDSEPANTWMVPNPYLAHFDWFGMALANFSSTTANVTLTAWHGGVVVAAMTIPIDPHLKTVDVSSGFWAGVNYTDVDLVTIDSDIPIAPPISITGNDEQDRHVFFLGQFERETVPAETHTYPIPHIATDRWTTALTIYNDMAAPAAVTLNTWLPDGTQDVIDGIFPVPEHGTLVLYAGTDFAYGGIGVLTTDNDIHAKLTYQYGTSESLCEFFLTETSASRWFIPNAIHEWFDWFGMALCNPTDEPIVVALDAYKDGAFVEIGTRLLMPHTKIVGLAEEIWPSTDVSKSGYNGVDMVVIRSNAQIPPPLSITGNTEQDRHVFFLSNRNRVRYPFADANFEAYCLANFDTDFSGSISTAEAEAVTAMDLPGSDGARGNIRDLAGIEMFTNLQFLQCDYEQLSWLPPLDALTDLRSLKVFGNYLVTLPPLDAQTLMTILNASYNNIQLLPSLDSLTSLLYLYIAENQLTVFPEVSGLTAITILDVGYNHLSSVPGIEALTTLQRVELTDNAFTTLPDLSASVGLRSLYVSRNELTTLPDLSIFPDLTLLHCGNNQLTEIPGLASMTNLDNFRCEDNMITDLSAVAGLTKLDNFACSENGLTALPDMSALTEMLYLYVSRNPITSIPGLTSMTKLRTLYADSTGITDFSDVAGLTTLERLYISDNAIAVLPDLSALDSLHTLHCQNSGLTDIPDVTGCDAIDTYYCYWNYFGQDDCPTIQAIEAMGLSLFDYNPQKGSGDLVCP